MVVDESITAERDDYFGDVAIVADVVRGVARFMVVDGQALLVD